MSNKEDKMENEQGCENGCDITDESELFDDGFCAACHEYPEG